MYKTSKFCEDIIALSPGPTYIFLAFQLLLKTQGGLSPINWKHGPQDKATCNNSITNSIITLTIGTDHCSIPGVILATRINSPPWRMTAVPQGCLTACALHIIQLDRSNTSAEIRSIQDGSDCRIETSSSTSYKGSVIVPVPVTDCAPFSVMKNLNDSLILTAIIGNVAWVTHSQIILTYVCVCVCVCVCVYVSECE